VAQPAESAAEDEGGQGGGRLGEVAAGLGNDLQDRGRAVRSKFPIAPGISEFTLQKKQSGEKVLPENDA
jgi:hypothetical protein